jgi:hypothetical protein
MTEPRLEAHTRVCVVEIIAVGIAAAGYHGLLGILTLDSPDGGIQRQCDLHAGARSLSDSDMGLRCKFRPAGAALDRGDGRTPPDRPVSPRPLDRNVPESGGGRKNLRKVQL